MSPTGLAHGHRTALPQPHEHRARPATDARPTVEAAERHGAPLAEE
ncbi:hypothetical protein [Streptomyces viridochromogenes]|nr:hypothetical protein [Streptomyces viridochromogenes]